MIFFLFLKLLGTGQECRCMNERVGAEINKRSL